MKRQLSVFTLLLRQTLYKLLAILGIMALAEGILWYFNVRTADFLLFDALDSSGMIWVFGIAFILVTLMLCFTGCDFGNKQSYSLRRLGVSEKNVFLWQCFNNSCCYLLLWGLQLAVVLAQSSVWTLSHGNQQTLMLTAYKSVLLFNLLPLSSVWGWIRNVVIVLGLGICTAQFPYMQRRNKTAIPWIIVTLLSVYACSRRLGVNDIFALVTCILITIGCTAWVLFRVLYIGGREDEN